MNSVSGITDIVDLFVMVVKLFGVATYYTTDEFSTNAEPAKIRFILCKRIQSMYLFEFSPNNLYLIFVLFIFINKLY